MPHIRGDGSTGDGKGKGHVGGSISQHTHASSYVKLVYNVIQGADQHGYDAGYGKPGQKAGSRAEYPVDFLELMKIS